MTDDLVRRLYAVQTDDIVGADLVELCEEAAIEIERLREYIWERRMRDG